MSVDDANTLTLPGDDDETARRRQNLLRRRLLDGNWLDELLGRIAEHFVEERQQAIGRPTMSRNLARTSIRSLSALYDQSPIELNATSSDADDEMLNLAHAAGIWQMGTRLQQRTLFIREGLRGVTTVGPPDAQRLLYQHIDLDRVWMNASPDNPDQPDQVVWGRRRIIEGKDVWTWDAWSIANGEPRFAVLKPRAVKPGQDVFEVADDLTSLVIEGAPEGGFVDDTYRWRYDAGEPFLPFVLYHAERTGKLTDSYEGIEMIDATLDVAMLWTFWLHDVKDASWPQRYVLNAILRGESIDGGEGFDKFANVPADPASIMQFYSDAMQAASFGQWLPGCDPNSLELAISSFERSTAAHFNLATSDFQTSSDAESGYALSIKRQAVREAQRRFEPQFRRGDEELLAKSAALCNRAGITNGASETDWRVSYPALPMSPEERQAALDRVDAYTKLGLPASRVWQVQQLEQVDRDGAMDLLVQWQRDDVELDERLAAEAPGVDEALSNEEMAKLRSMLDVQAAPLSDAPRQSVAVEER